ncbi:MAG: polysaccharide biosynthesis/export family protein [Myxococcota bacterium]
MTLSSAARVLICSLLGGAACRSTSVPPEALQPLPIVSDALDVGDAIEVRVFREPDLAGVFQIGTSGEIDYPLIGAIMAKGHTPLTLQSEIEALLEDGYLVDAQVTVLVKERASRKIHVLGAVQKPGSFPFEPGMTVIQAITNAGGFSQLAAQNSVTITRRRDGEEVSFQVRVGSIQSGSSPNVYLQPLDIIFVREAIF